MKFFSDTWLLFQRHVIKTLRMPVWLFIGLMQPVLYLLLYMPLLKNIAGAPGLPEGEIVRMFVPGMLVIMAMGSLFAGFSFIDEIRVGIIARWLVTPASRLGIILSLVLSQALTLFLQASILLGIAWFFGLSVPFSGIALTMVLVLIIGMAMSALSYAISLSVQEESALASITNTFYLPIMLLSGIMLPIAIAPDWIKTAAKFNPFYYAVEGARALFSGSVADMLVLKGFAVMTGLAVLMIGLAIRALRKMTA
jgi:ABC-2 type transport system permease protein